MYFLTIIFQIIDKKFCYIRLKVIFTIFLNPTTLSTFKDLYEPCVHTGIFGAMIRGFLECCDDCTSSFPLTSETSITHDVFGIQSHDITAEL